MSAKQMFNRFMILSLPFLSLLPLNVKAQDTLNSQPEPAKYGGTALSQVMEPTTTPYGTGGMSNVISAEPLGSGRLGMQLRGNFYSQGKTVAGTVPINTQVTTLTFGAALGINPYLDGFVGLGAYNLHGGNGPSGSGAGTAVLGAQASLPLPENVPVHLALQVASLFGIAGKQIDTTHRLSGESGAYGYNYLETRKSTDIMARFAQSFIFAGENMGIKLHFNEGLISSFESGKNLLLVTGAGLQFIVTPPLVLGIEINDRTFVSKILASDPMWITPSVVFRTPAHLNVEAGADISISADRADGNRTLEPWRGFLGLTFSYDTQADRRKAEAEAARKEAMEKARLANMAKDAIATRDSLAAANAADKANIANQNADDKAKQQAIADSLAEKARQDAAALAASQSNLDATQRALQEERAKRSDAEKQLLSTGNLLMDAVYFKTGKTDISINSYPYLNIIAKMLVKYPKLQIEVAGHTDNVGGQASNQSLSQGRAEGVMRYMQQKEPALQGMLTAKGYAFSQPKASNSTEEGRKFNRRTELQVTNKDALKEYNP